MIKIDAIPNEDIKDPPTKTLKHIISVNNTHIKDITNMRKTEKERPTNANVKVKSQGV